MHLGRALAIGGSIALHVGALAGMLLLAASLRQPEPLFVDLTTGDLTTGGLTTGNRTAGSLTTGHLATGQPAASAQAAEERRPAARRSTESKTAASSSPEPGRASALAAPEPARPAEVAPARESPRPLSGEMTRTDPAPSSPVADSPADGKVSAPSPASTGGAGGTAGGGAGSGVASDAPSGAGQGASAGGGSRLALAGPGAGRSEVPAEFGPYLASFRRRIQELVVYPLAARRRGLAGKVEVEVVLEPTGRVRDVAVVASSSHSMLDDAALDAVRSLSPVPLPENLPRRPLRVRLPIVFDLR
jgi:periplasmic protein TonB